MPADPNTGLRIGQTQVFPKGTHYATYRLGGTSLSSPLFAGVLADAIQDTGSAVGFINPLLYEVSGTSAISDVLPTSSPQSTVRTNYTNELNKSHGYFYELQTIGVADSDRDAEGLRRHDRCRHPERCGVPEGHAKLKRLVVV